MASDLIELAHYIVTGRATLSVRLGADRELIRGIVNEVVAATS